MPFFRRKSKIWAKLDSFERHLHRCRGMQAQNGNLKAQTALIWEGRRIAAVLKFDLPLRLHYSSDIGRHDRSSNVFDILASGSYSPSKLGYTGIFIFPAEGRVDLELSCKLEAFPSPSKMGTFRLRRDEKRVKPIGSRAITWI